jgi:hypothetical protein
MAGDTQRRGRGRAVIAVSVLLFLPTTGLAGTTALYSLGYGATSSSMAGATLASGSDALNQFGNPANLSFIPKRLDINVTYLRSDLHFKNALNDKNNERGFAGFPLSDNNFFIPAFGVTYPLAGTNFTGGFQLYGVGGDASRFILDRGNASYANKTLVKYSSSKAALSRLTLMPLVQVASCRKRLRARWRKTATFSAAWSRRNRLWSS